MEEEQSGFMGFSKRFSMMIAQTYNTLAVLNRWVSSLLWLGCRQQRKKTIKCNLH